MFVMFLSSLEIHLKAAIAYYIQQVTSFDLNIRPFLVNYSCRDCVKVYKQWWKIVALVWAGTCVDVLLTA